MGLLANHLQKTGLWSIVHVTSMRALASNPAPRSALILTLLPWLVKIVIHFPVIGSVWMEPGRHRVGVRGRSLCPGRIFSSAAILANKQVEWIGTRQTRGRESAGVLS